MDQFILILKKSYKINCFLQENSQKVKQLLCDETDYKKYPDFTVKISNKDFPVPPEFYIRYCFYKLTLKKICR